MKPVRLTSEDWVEIYYALDTKIDLIASGFYDPEDTWRQNSEWINHLSAIKRKIGPISGKEGELTVGVAPVDGSVDA